MSDREMNIPENEEKPVKWETLAVLGVLGLLAVLYLFNSGDGLGIDPWLFSPKGEILGMYCKGMEDKPAASIGPFRYQTGCQRNQRRIKFIDLDEKEYWCTLGEAMKGVGSLVDSFAGKNGSRN